MNQIDPMPDESLYESIARRLDDDAYQMRAWLSLVGCFSSVERALMRRFTQKYNSSLPRYDVLTALALFPDGLTMGQLARKLMVSKGNITGVVRRLGQDGLIRKLTSREDRRVQLVTISASGMKLWNKMHAEYAELIEEMLQGVSAGQAEGLSKSLAKTRAAIVRVASEV